MHEALATIRDHWKFRLRMALALRDPPPPEPATLDELGQLVALQTAYWLRQTPLSGLPGQAALKELNDRSISAFVLSVHGNDVRLWDKRAFSFAPEELALRSSEQRRFQKRAQYYRAFIEKVVRRSRSAHAIDIAVDVNDIPEDSPELPIFGFQKMRGAHNLLLPDVDFFHSKWYRENRDTLPYDDKSVSACFVGSSSGAWLSVQSIRNRETPRLHAAATFHGHPRVVFRIAKAAHCLTEEARQELVSQPYFGSPASWEEQLRHRFLLSMDGNGAACSRLIEGLRSNGVVIKFDSPYELYYFPALKPGIDHLLATKEEDVERFIEREAAEPGTFKPVATAGRRFALKYLTIYSVMDYTAALLAAYAGLTRRPCTRVSGAPWTGRNGAQAGVFQRVV